MKIFLIDFDGTIADTMPHVVSCTKKTIKKYNLTKLENDSMAKFNGAVLEDVFVELGAQKNQLEKIVKYYRKIFSNDYSNIKTYPNVITTIKRLKKQGNKIVIASNRGRESLTSLLTYFGLNKYIDLIISEDDVENKKPAPDMVYLAKQKLNLTDEEIYVIGDTKFDIKMGKNANCKTIGIYYTDDLLKSFDEEKPDFLITNFEELFKIVPDLKCF